VIKCLDKKSPPKRAIITTSLTGFPQNQSRYCILLLLDGWAIFIDQQLHGGVVEDRYQLRQPTFV